MAKKNVAGRPRIGLPISVTVTEDTRKWIDAQVRGGGSRCEVVRRILDMVQDLEAAGTPLEVAWVEARAGRARKRTG